jgi:hypothetical protein
MHTREGISRKISSEDVVVFGFLCAVSLWTYVFLPLFNPTSQEGRTMSLKDWTDILTAAGAVVAAVAAIYTAYFAWRAADTWRKSIKLQRFDDAIMAALELRSRAATYSTLST